MRKVIYSTISSNASIILCIQYANQYGWSKGFWEFLLRGSELLAFKYLAYGQGEPILMLALHDAQISIGLASNL